MGARSGSLCGVVDLGFRAATAAESDFLADTVFGDPSQETTRVAMALYGVENPERLRRLYRIIWRGAENWKNTELAIDGDRPSAWSKRGDPRSRSRRELLSR
jgi:hypothetical protein